MSVTRVTVYGKLVRDQIPRLIERRGATLIVWVLDLLASAAALSAMLIEESTELAQELGQGRGVGDVRVFGEFADVLEVRRAIAALYGIHDGPRVAGEEAGLERRSLSELLGMLRDAADTVGAANAVEIPDALAAWRRLRRCWRTS